MISVVSGYKSETSDTFSLLNVLANMLDILDEIVK